MKNEEICNPILSLMYFLLPYVYPKLDLLLIDIKNDYGSDLNPCLLQPETYTGFEDVAVLRHIAEPVLEHVTSIPVA